MTLWKSFGPHLGQLPAGQSPINSLHFTSQRPISPYNRTAEENSSTDNNAALSIQRVYRGTTSRERIAKKRYKPSLCTLVS